MSTMGVSLSLAQIAPVLGIPFMQASPERVMAELKEVYECCLATPDTTVYRAYIYLVPPETGKYDLRVVQGWLMHFMALGGLHVVAGPGERPHDSISAEIDSGCCVTTLGAAMGHNKSMLAMDGPDEAMQAATDELRKLYPPPEWWANIPPERLGNTVTDAMFEAKMEREGEEVLRVSVPIRIPVPTGEVN